MFTGFSDATIDFLWELRFHNERPWFLEHKQVFGVTFEQGRQELAINDELISNIVTENKELTEEAKRDLKVSLIVLKYTQSRPLASAQGSSPAFTVRGWRAIRRITGSYASARRC